LLVSQLWALASGRMQNIAAADTNTIRFIFSPRGLYQRRAQTL
jgi:hypothetical protein